MQLPEELNSLSVNDVTFCQLTNRLFMQVGGERGLQLSHELIEFARVYATGAKPPETSISLAAAFSIVKRFLVLRAPLFMTGEMVTKWDAAGQHDALWCSFCGAMHPPGYNACEICGDGLTSDPGLSFRTLMESAKVAEAAQAQGQAVAAAGLTAWLN